MARVAGAAEGSRGDGCWDAFERGDGDSSGSRIAGRATGDATGLVLRLGSDVGWPVAVRSRPQAGRLIARMEAGRDGFGGGRELAAETDYPLPHVEASEPP